MTDTLTLSILLIILGVLLLLVDLFLYSGFLLALAVGAIVVGVALPFFYGETATGMVAVVTVLVVVPALVVLVFHYSKKTAIGRRMFLTGPDEDATIASMPVIVELEQLRGKVGRAVSPLRPSGTVDFEGRPVDVLTESLMVEEGTWVRCIDVKAGKVIVRPIDTPQLDNLEL